MLCLAKGSAAPKTVRSSHERAPLPRRTLHGQRNPRRLVGTEHAVALLCNNLFGLRDGEGHGGVAVLEHVGAHEAVLLEAVGELLGDGTGGQPFGALAA